MRALVCVFRTTANQFKTTPDGKYAYYHAACIRYYYPQLYSCAYTSNPSRAPPTPPPSSNRVFDDRRERARTRTQIICRIIAHAIPAVYNNNIIITATAFAVGISINIGHGSYIRGPKNAPRRLNRRAREQLYTTRPLRRRLSL